MLNLFQFTMKLLFGCSESGSLIISSSIPSIFIRTGWTPKHVFISIHNNHGNPTCGSNQDWFDVKTVHRGFVIQSNVKSNFRKITWIAVK